jgi:ssDNA-binding Zn-finger/Zn-ribbon topoisomerase 1
MPTFSLGDLCCAGKISGKLAGFLCKENVQHLGNNSKGISHIPEFHFDDKFHDQVFQEGHKDEHPTGREESASGVNAVARCDSASDVNVRRTEKGKEKVIYNNSNCVSNTKKSNDSIESIESCPSTKVTKRKNVEYSAANMSYGNKRRRREDNKSSCSGILQKRGSSFFNWMSSLTKGLIMLDETTTAVPLDQTCAATTVEESAVPPLPIQSSSCIPMQSAGFNSLFQSLYSHNVKMTSRNISHQPESNRTEHVPNRATLDLKGSNSVLDKYIDMGRDVTTGH